MTGYDVYKRVLNISGYQNENQITVDKHILNVRILDMINQICLDLNIESIKNLEDEIKTDSKNQDALFYGVAMLLSISDNEPQKNLLFTQIYNAKRSSALSSKEQIEDKLPKTTGG